MWKFNYRDLRNYRNKRETMLETIFLPLLQRFNPAEPVVEKSVIL
jgi:hypothetical protein